jgi:hypothetical protein
MRNIVFSYASRDQNHHSGNYDRRDSLFQELTSRIDASKGVVVGKTFLTRARVPSYRRSNAHDAVVLTEL